MSEKKTVWSVTGMHCVHCETAVVRAVTGLPGLKEARANYKSATLTAVWDEKRSRRKRLSGRYLRPDTGCVASNAKQMKQCELLGYSSQLSRCTFW